MEDESDKSDSEEKSDEKEDTDKDTSTEDESDESDSEHVTPGKWARAKVCRVKRQPVPNDLLPGALVMIPNNSRHFGLRGILGQIIGKGLKGRYRVQLAPQPNRDVLTCQLVELAFELGMIMDDFVVIPKSNYAMVLKANKAYKEMGTSQKDFSANAIFDSGSELLLTGCKGILHNFRKLNKPMIAEGVHTTEAQYTHGGDVYFVMPGGVRTAVAYYHPDETMTIVPAGMWDDGEHFFTCKDRTLHLYKKDIDDDSPVALGSYPRDIALEEGKHYNADFIQCLSTQAIKGKKRHDLYPIPDSIFLWANDTKEHGTVEVVDVEESVSTTISKNKPSQNDEEVEASHTINEVKFSELTSENSNEDETVVDGISLPLPIEHVECLGGSEFSHDYEAIQDLLSTAIQDFLSTPDDHVTHEQKKQAAIEKAQELYDESHPVLGHRSREHNMRQIEWIYGNRMPSVVENMLEHCRGCDLSKLTSDLAPFRPSYHSAATIPSGGVGVSSSASLSSSTAVPEVQIVDVTTGVNTSGGDSTLDESEGIDADVRNQSDGFFTTHWIEVGQAAREAKGGCTSLALAGISAHNASGKTGPGPPAMVKSLR